MKKLLFTLFAVSALLVTACKGTDKTNRESDTSAAKGSGGPADSTKAVSTSSASGGSAATSGSSDTSNTGKSTADPAAADTTPRPVH